MSHTKLSIGLGLAALLGLSSVAQAVDYEISGHINRMIRFADNGDESDMQHVDNSANESRIGLRANTEAGGWGVELYTELRMDINESSEVDIYDDEGGREDPELEYADLRFTSPGGAVISLGQGDGAAYWAQRQDLSGTELADNFDNRRIAGLSLRDDMGGFTGWYGDHVIGWYEGSRSTRLRVDSPSFAGMRAALSFGEGRSYEFSLRGDTDNEGSYYNIEGWRFKWMVGYSNTGNGEDSTNYSGDVEDSIAASVSALAAGGFGVTLGYGEASMNYGIKDEKGYYVKPFFRSGDNAYSISYGQNQDLDDGDYDADFWAISWQHTYGNGVVSYASYQSMDISENAGTDDTDDLKVFLFGVRVGF